MESKASLNNIMQDAIRVIKDPTGFYRDMPRSGGFADPVIFLLVMAAVMGIVIAVFSLFGAGFVGAMAVGMGAVIVMPIFAAIGSFIGAAILFVIWKLMGSTENYQTAYRCVAYATAIYPITAVLGMLPYIGTLIGIAWGFYLMAIASVEVHGVTRKTAFIVFAVLGVFTLLMNLSSEMAARQMAERAEIFGERYQGAGKQLENLDEMTPEEAGQAVGEFLRGLDGATQEMQEREKAESASGDAASEPYQ